MIKNKKAYFDYQISSKLEAGIALKGSEVKSIREGNASLVDSYIRLKDSEAFAINIYIAPYFFDNSELYNERRERKLLLHKNEIMKLEIQLKQKGFTLIPLSLYFKRGRAKLEIGLGKGKKHFDKRESIKNREHKREIDRHLKS
jgi:SsrA-binding protein